MDVTIQQVFDADEEMASKFDKPAKSGLQTLTAEEQDELLTFLDDRLEHAEWVDGHRTSQYLAGQANRYFRKEKGKKVYISNLMIKSAMYLLGFTPSVKNVDIHHYRIRKKEKEGSL